MDTLLEILEEIRPDVDFEKEASLIGDGILSSFDIISIVSELEDEFDIHIRPADIIPANFNSAKAMLEMVERLQK